MNEFKSRKVVRAGTEIGLGQFQWGAPETFLGIPSEQAPLSSARVVILPVPYEATVTYMPGTRFGPRGILQASHFIELYDHELDSEPYTLGVHTLPELMLPAAGPQAALAELRQVIDVLLNAGKFVIMLGGEHSLSAPSILAHADRLAGSRLSVLQLDAHADLRTEYDGTPYSHASVMHQVHERVDLAPVGIRSLTRAERTLMREKRITAIFAHEMESNAWIGRAVESLGPHVYITIDVDFFDPGLMPSTGAPEPGGPSWYAALKLLERVFAERHVVGCDVVELAPIPGIVAPDFLAAKLVYKLVGFLQRATRAD